MKNICIGKMPENIAENNIIACKFSIIVPSKILLMSFHFIQGIDDNPERNQKPDYFGIAKSRIVRMDRG